MKILEPYRAKIDSLDDKIVDLLVEREQIIREVADLKAENNIPPILQDRVDEVRERCADRAIEKNMDGNYVREIYRKIITLSCNLEEQIAAKLSPKKENQK